MENIRVLRGSVEGAGRGVTWLLGVPHAPKTILSSVRCLQFDAKTDEPEYGLEAGKKTQLSICIYLCVILEIVEDFRVCYRVEFWESPCVLLIFHLLALVFISIARKIQQKGKDKHREPWHDKIEASWLKNSACSSSAKEKSS